MSFSPFGAKLFAGSCNYLCIYDIIYESQTQQYHPVLISNICLAATKYFEEANADPVIYHWKYHLDEIDPSEQVQVETLPLKKSS